MSAKVTSSKKQPRSASVPAAPSLDKVERKRKRAEQEAKNLASATLSAATAAAAAVKLPSAASASNEAGEDPSLLAKMPLRPSWMPLPSAAVCAQHGWAAWSPKPLGSAFAKAVIELPSAASAGDSVWPAAVAVLDVYAAAQQAGSVSGDAAVPSKQLHIVIVVCESLITASAVAWAARCRGIPHVSFAFSVADEDLAKHPEEHFHGASLILLSAAVLRRSVTTVGQKKVGSDMGMWLDGRTVVVMPDVLQPADFQTMTSRAIFFALAPPVGSPTKGSKGKRLDTHIAAADVGAVTHRVSAIGPAAALTPVDLQQCSSILAPRTDNELQNLLARGDLKGAIERVVSIYRAGRSRCEDVLLNAFVSNWGATSNLQAHHKLAYAMRVLCDRSKREEEKVSLPLHTLALRVLCKCVRMLPPIDATCAKTVADFLPNLTLQATVCYIFDMTSASVVDALGAGWGIKAVICGAKALEGFDKKRQEQVHRVRTRFAARLGAEYAAFLAILTHIITSATTAWAMTLEDVDHLLQWSATLQHDCGPLRAFLIDAMLLPASGGPQGGGAATAALGADRRAANAGASGLVRPQKGLGSKLLGEKAGTKVNTQTLSLPTQKLPLVGTRARQKESLAKMAVEEVLSAMPRQPIPMYIGDVGQLIGIWSKFNAKYDGALPTTLSQFLLDHPEAFKVVQNVVVRVRAGTVEQQKIRYDRDDDGSDSDGEGGMKGAAGRKVHRKARRKDHLQEVNRRRFNKNHKKFDPESRVPGYKKPKMRAIKGRGVKKNIRRFK